MEQNLQGREAEFERQKREWQLQTEKEQEAAIEQLKGK